MLEALQVDFVKWPAFGVEGDDVEMAVDRMDFRRFDDDLIREGAWEFFDAGGARLKILFTSPGGIVIRLDRDRPVTAPDLAKALSRYLRAVGVPLDRDVELVDLIGRYRKFRRR